MTLSFVSLACLLHDVAKAAKALVRSPAETLGAFRYDVWSKKPTRLGLLVLSFALLGEATAQNQAPGQPPGPLPTNPAANDEMVEIKLPDADIDTVLSALEIYTGRVATLRPA